MADFLGDKGLTSRQPLLAIACCVAGPLPIPDPVSGWVIGWQEGTSSMIDYFAIALTHAPLALACLRLLTRNDLDRDPAREEVPLEGGERRPNGGSAVLDLFLTGFVGLILLMGLRRPFVWVLAYLYVDIVAPQKISYALLTNVQLAGGVHAGGGGWLFFDNKQGARVSGRQVLMVMLLVYYFHHPIGRFPGRGGG
jgi:hypothetical protein